MLLLSITQVVFKSCTIFDFCGFFFPNAYTQNMFPLGSIPSTEERTKVNIICLLSHKLTDGGPGGKRRDE